MKHRAVSPAPVLPAWPPGALTVDIPDLSTDDAEFRSPFRRKCFNSPLKPVGVVACALLTAWCLYLAIHDPSLSTIPLFVPDSSTKPSWFAQSWDSSGPLLAIPNTVRFEPLLCRWSCRYMPHGSAAGVPLITLYDSVDDALRDLLSDANHTNGPLTASSGPVFDGSPHWLADVHAVDIFLEEKHGFDPLCRLCGVATTLLDENYTGVATQHTSEGITAPFPRQFVDANLLKPQPRYDYKSYDIPWGNIREYGIKHGEELGAGHYGSVSPGKRLSDRRPCAIKRLTRVAYWKYQREALILSELERGNCPHVVEFLGPASNKPLTRVNVVDGYAPSDVQLYFIFERVNVDPEEYLSELTAPRLQSVLRQLVQALACAHGLGIIHRDLKWDNVAVNLTSGQATLIDWGLSEFYIPGRSYNNRVCTQSYKPPELLMHGVRAPQQYAIDMWSLGAMMADVIFGQEPFFYRNKTLEKNYAQLLKIAEVLGTAEIKAYAERYGNQVAIDAASVLPELPRKPWSVFLPPNNIGKASPEAIDFLEKLLRVDPVERMTASEALRHPYLIQKVFPKVDTRPGETDTDFETATTPSPIHRGMLRQIRSKMSLDEGEVLPTFSPCASPANTFASRMRSPAKVSTSTRDSSGRNKIVLLLVLAAIAGTAALSTGLITLSSGGGVDGAGSDGDRLTNWSSEVAATQGKDPIVVLSNGDGLWNTGVWSGWGMGDHVTLNWAAAGVEVHKMCPTKCVITKDQRFIEDADLVVMELVNHLKFLGEDKARKTALPWPKKRADGGPAVANFYLEPASQFHDYTVSPALAAHVDVTVAPALTSTIPVNTICTWGRSLEAFLAPPPAKVPGRAIAYFNDHGIAPQYREFVTEFVKIMGPDRVHAYGTLANRPTPLEAGGVPYRLENRLEFLSTYKFHLITEFALEDDWIEPEWSQAFIAGTVPIYAGAPNIRDYRPGDHSYISVSDFKSPADMAHYVSAFLEDDQRYAGMFDWKKEGLLDRFKYHVSNCVHFAECRMCELAHKIREKRTAGVAAAHS